MTQDSPTNALPPGLLPEGLRDVLSPRAGHEAAMISALMGCFAAHGFDRVQPPLVEFEAGLLDGPGATIIDHAFRLMDPVSQRMMAVRPDMTLQVARIATTRLIRAPRPLRLSYGGQVLRVRGTQLRPERQFAQAGVELIGAAEPAADTEVMLLAAEALGGLGVRELSIDLTMPPLVPTLCRVLGMSDAERTRARTALDRKDADAVAALGGEAGRLLGGLLDAAGPVDTAMAALERLDLPEDVAVERRFFAEVVAGVRRAAPDLRLTIDAVENRGFEYHTGASFTLFARRVRGELGRGGRYLVRRADGGAPEQATGFTLFMDSVMRAVPAPAPARRIYLPAGTPVQVGASLRAEGWVTLAGLTTLDAGEIAAEARRLNCSYYCRGGQAVAVDKETAG